MSDTVPSIEQARFPEDAETVGDLLLDYIAYLVERMPQERESILQKYDPAKIDATVATFERLHAPPEGALLIARRDGAPVGCGMMREMAPGIAELQRIFVREEARGTGVGKALTLALMQAARDSGKTTVRLDTGRPMAETVAFYERLGFAERPPYHDETPFMNHILAYFERAL